MTIATVTVDTPITRDSREPNRTRENRSRLLLSTPMRYSVCSAGQPSAWIHGAERRVASLMISLGLYGASTSANSAIKIKTPKIRAPTWAERCRRRRRQVSCSGVRGWLVARPSASSVATGAVTVVGVAMRAAAYWRRMRGSRYVYERSVIRLTSTKTMAMTTVKPWISG